MASSVRSANAKVKTCVITSSSILLTLQIVAFIATIFFYLVASSAKYRDETAKLILPALYPHYQVLWLRGERALEDHIVIAGAVELLLLFPTIFLVIGATKQIRCLMLPFLVIFGLAQILIMAAIVACVMYLPMESKPLAMAVTAFEAFVIFPWWFGAIHLFAVYDKPQVHGSYLIYPPSSSGLVKNGIVIDSDHAYPISNRTRSRSLCDGSHTRSMLI